MWPENYEKNLTSLYDYIKETDDAAPHGIYHEAAVVDLTLSHDQVTLLRECIQEQIKVCKGGCRTTLTPAVIADIVSIIAYPSSEIWKYWNVSKTEIENLRRTQKMSVKYWCMKNGFDFDAVEDDLKRGEYASLWVDKV